MGNAERNHPILEIGEINLKEYLENLKTWMIMGDIDENCEFEPWRDIYISTCKMLEAIGQLENG